MTGQEFEARVIDWAKRQPDVDALIQIGSRAQPDAEVDRWSDWDYHLIVRDVARYRNVAWPIAIAPCWLVHIEQTERSVAKLSVVFESGYEVDFVPLSSWQMKLVYWCMARPSLRPILPQKLTKGIANTQLIVRPGYRVLVGGGDWEQRLSALNQVWPTIDFSSSDYEFHVSGFWRHAVWVFKKLARGESRAALRWYFVELSEHRWAMLEEESRIAGRLIRPEARKAERWLDTKRLSQTEIEIGANQQILARALLIEIVLFEEASQSVAASRGFTQQDYSAVAEWLRAELTQIAGPT